MTSPTIGSSPLPGSKRPRPLAALEDLEEDDGVPSTPRSLPPEDVDDDDVVESLRQRAQKSPKKRPDPQQQPLGPSQRFLDARVPYEDSDAEAALAWRRAYVPRYFRCVVEVPPARGGCGAAPRPQKRARGAAKRPRSQEDSPPKEMNSQERAAAAAVPPEPRYVQACLAVELDEAFAVDWDGRRVGPARAVRHLCDALGDAVVEIDARPRRTAVRFAPEAGAHVPLGDKRVVLLEEVPAEAYRDGTLFLGSSAAAAVSAMSAWRAQFNAAAASAKTDDAAAASPQSARGIRSALLCTPKFANSRHRARAPAGLCRRSRAWFARR
jgi:hypothetical protein